MDAITTDTQVTWAPSVAEREHCVAPALSAAVQGDSAQEELFLRLF